MTKKASTISEQRSISELSLSSTGSFNKDGVRIAPDYREVKLREMMKYYTPRWMAFVGLLASIASAFQLPMFGFILAQYVFVLACLLYTSDAADE